MDNPKWLKIIIVISILANLIFVMRWGDSRDIAQEKELLQLENDSLLGANLLIQDSINSIQGELKKIREAKYTLRMQFDSTLTQIDVLKTKIDEKIRIVRGINGTTDLARAFSGINFTAPADTSQ